MKLIFVCTGNTCRSPMAEAFAKDVFKDKNITITSRGISVYESSPASENAVTVATDMGLDLGSHVSRQLSNEDIEEADIILTMTRGHKELIGSLFQSKKDVVLTLKEFATGIDADVCDPFGLDIEAYKKCAQEIKEYIEKLSEKLGM